MKKYYIRRNGQEKGPFTLEQIYQSSIEATDFIWTEGMPGWQQAMTMAQFKGMFPSRLQMVHAAFNQVETKAGEAPQANVKGYVYIIVGTILIFGFFALAFILIGIRQRLIAIPRRSDDLLAVLVLLAILGGGIQFLRLGLRCLSSGRK